MFESPTRLILINVFVQRSEIPQNGNYNMEHGPTDQRLTQIGIFRNWEPTKPQSHRFLTKM